MASSENLASLEPWIFRPAFPDSWISEAYALDTEALTRALHISLSSTPTTLLSDGLDPFLDLIASSDPATPTPTASNLSASASDPETPAAPPKLQRSALLPGASKKATKRKSRASKRSQTTFITADPANFRQMVQQVTGVRFGTSQVPVVPVLKPEPQRPYGGRLPGSAAAAGCLPTLDTSAFLLDHHLHQQQQQVVVGSSSGPVVGVGPLGFSQHVDGAEAAAVGLDFETVASFPTLESWKVM